MEGTGCGIWERGCGVRGVRWRGWGAGCGVREEGCGGQDVG